VQEGAGTIKYLYDLDKVVLERDGSGNLLARYTHEGGSLYHDLVSMKRGGASYYFLFDGLGSVTEVVDGSEATQNSYRYEAFGQVQSSTENVANPYRYVGAYGVHWDAAPALYFMQARYYALDIGRFITPDPVRGAMLDPISLHLYIYVRNNPMLLVDARGWSPALSRSSCRGESDPCQDWANSGELTACLSCCTKKFSSCVAHKNLWKPWRWPACWVWWGTCQDLCMATCGAAGPNVPLP